MSRERLKLPVIRIQLEEVGTPPELEMACNSCEGVLVYGSFPYIGIGPYCRVEAPLIWGYRCESCDLKLYLPEMAKQLNRLALEAMKNQGIWPPQEDL